MTPFAATWDTTTYADGLYDLRVVTTDNVGTVFTSPTIANVRVDNTAPTGAITAPLANTFVSGASVAVSANSADAGSGVASAQFQTSPHGSGTWTNLGAADVATPYGVTWNTTTFSNGQYDLQVVTTDKSGNTFTSASVMVEVQNGAPTATAVQLLDTGGAAGKAEQGDQIVVTFSQTLRVSTLCSVWSGDFSDQMLATPGDVTVTLADGGAANDTLTMASTTCTLHFGAVNLGATGYVAGGSVDVLRLHSGGCLDGRLERGDAHAHRDARQARGLGHGGHRREQQRDLHARLRSQERLRDDDHRHLQHRDRPALLSERWAGASEALGNCRSEMHIAAVPASQSRFDPFFRSTLVS